MQYVLLIFGHNIFFNMMFRICTKIRVEIVFISDTSYKIYSWKTVFCFLHGTLHAFQSFPIYIKQIFFYILAVFCFLLITSTAEPAFVLLLLLLEVIQYADRWETRVCTCFTLHWLHKCGDKKYFVIIIIMRIFCYCLKIQVEIIICLVPEWDGLDGHYTADSENIYVQYVLHSSHASATVLVNVSSNVL